FAAERDVHDASLTAYALPPLPPGVRTPAGQRGGGAGSGPPAAAGPPTPAGEPFVPERREIIAPEMRP
ncbi:MAG TPA: hypothetical protein VGY97_13350, partial [Solirubrobacteraceae bacterium]|nr:hypothetical protein [Solirubrobacteraceae bacterium]